jgi:KDO2-lipid IV(A) lauroyltransferase
LRQSSPLSIARWLVRRPLSFLHALGGFLGWCAWWGSPGYRRLLRENARRGGVTPAQRRRAIAEAGRMLAELPWLWLRPHDDARLAAGCRWHGEALIEQGLAAGRGLLVLTPHMGAFEVCAQAYAERFGHLAPATVLYRPARQDWLRDLQRQGRERPGMKAAPASLAGVRQMLKALRAGETVGLLPDQVPPEGLGVWAPFYGHPAYTMTLAHRLVRQTGAAVVLMWCERLPRGRGYVLHVSAPVEPLTDEDELAAAAAINREMERVIAQSPGQYLWGYDRYKHPRGLPGIFGSVA